LFLEEIRVPAYLKVIIEPGDTWTRQSEYPTFHPAYVSTVRDAASEVDVRITKYLHLFHPDKLVKIPGAEEYFAAFNEDTKDNPEETPLFRIFKGLNEIVLTSPIMDPYRQMLAPPTKVPELPEEGVIKSAKASESVPQQQPAEVTEPQPEESRWLWLIGMIALLTALALILRKFLKK
jgi:hypothetical protein